MNPLGELERAVMEVLWAADAPLSVREVLDRLDDRHPAYTTALTVLDRLARKGTVQRELVGRAWYYTPTSSREEYVTRLMMSALELAGSRDLALTHFARSVDAKEADILRKALEPPRRRKPGNGRREPRR